MPHIHGWPFPENPRNNSFPALWRFKSFLVVRAIGLFSKVLLARLNSVQIHNGPRLLEAVQNRKEKQPLITVSNHTSCIDDPLLWGVLPVSVFRNQVIRWVPAADEICFTNKTIQRFFSLGQCVPVCRGDGVYQSAVDFCSRRLNLGEWVHMFVEGKINLTHELMRFKWGVGRLIADCEENPLVLPLWHIGMEDVLPNRRPYIPQIGKKVTLLVGEPIDFKDVIAALRATNSNSMEVRKAITDRLQEEMYRLRLQATKLHLQKFGTS